MNIELIQNQIDNFKPGDLSSPNALVSPAQFLAEYAYTSARFSKRPMAQAMYVEGDRIGNIFQNGLVQALRRDKCVLENIDSYAKMITNGQRNGRILKQGAFNPNFDVLVEKERLFAEFQRMGGDLVFLNPPKGSGRFLPQAGRNHMKFYFGNDSEGREFVFAGKVNISEGDFQDRPDFLVKFTDPGIRSAFEGLFFDSRTRRLCQDSTMQCNDQTVLYVDSGRPLQSNIQGKMVNALNAANETIEGIEPFIPDLINFPALNRAHRRGVHVDIVSSDPRLITDQNLTRTNTFNRFLFDRFGDRRYLSLYPGWIHAAMRVFDRKSVIFTTHNLSFWGVALGTTEWAVKSTDPELVSQCIEFFEETKRRSVLYR